MSNTEGGYRDASKLTQWVKIMLNVQIFVALIAVGSNFLEYQLLSDFQDGLYTSQERAVADAEASDLRQQVIAVISLTVLLISAFIILRWIHRANYNARQLGAKGMEFTPGWSIGYYFIPILTFWKPYQAMKEIWQASHNPSNWQAEQVSGILGVWWFLWLAGNFAGQASFRMSNSAEGISELMNVNLVTQVSDILGIPLAMVLLVIVKRISTAQQNACQNVSNTLQPESDESAE